MKCFIHTGVEAIASCKTCGKGMCSNCSAYSGHTGVCPACRKKEFEREVARCQSEKVSYIWKAIGSGLISFLIIPIFFFPIYEGDIIVSACTLIYGVQADKMIVL